MDTLGVVFRACPKLVYFLNMEMFGATYITQYTLGMIAVMYFKRHIKDVKNLPRQFVEQFGMAKHRDNIFDLLLQTQSSYVCIDYENGRSHEKSRLYNLAMSDAFANLTEGRVQRKSTIVSMTLMTAMWRKNGFIPPLPPPKCTMITESITITISEAKECCVCLRSWADVKGIRFVVLLPCKHDLLCVKCGPCFKGKPCPLCRGIVKKVRQ